MLDLKGQLLEAAEAGKKRNAADKYPLQAASYVSAVVDLTNACWVETLSKAGAMRSAFLAALLSTKCLAFSRMLLKCCILKDSIDC